MKASIPDYLIAIVIFFLLPSIFYSQIVYDSYGNTYIVINPKMIRGSVGYSQMNLTMDTIAPRKALGIHMRDEVRIISAFMKPKNKFVARDAFFCDLTLGKLTSDPLYRTKHPETKFSVVFIFGYDIMVGYRNSKIAVLAGVKLQWSTSFIGESWLPGDPLLLGTKPLMARMEYRIAQADEFRIVATGWTNFTDEKKSQGFSIDFPFSKKRRFWLTFEYRVQSGNATPAINYYKPVTGTLNQWFAGIKVGSIY